MTPSMEDRLGALLAERAEQAPTVPDLGSRAVARGRQARRRRRSTAVLASGLAVAVLVSAGAYLAAGSRDDRTQPPAVTPTPTVTDDQQEPDGASAAEIQRWLSGLPTGRPPAVPFSVGDKIVDGASTIASPDMQTFPIARTANGLLVLRHSEGFTGAEDYDAEYRLVDPDGRVTVLAKGMPIGAAVSADGTRVAVGVAPAGKDAVLRVVDVRYREVVEALQVTPDAAAVHGWAGDGVVVTTAQTGVPSTSLWQLGERLTVLGVRMAVRAAYPRAGLLLLGTEGDTCTDLVPVEDLAHPVLRHRCGPDQVMSVSPRGTWALDANGVVTGLTSVDVGHDGRLGVPGIPLWDAVWEDEEHVLLPVTDPSGADRPAFRPVVVRCSAPGWKCEIAAVPSAANGAAGHFTLGQP